MNFSPKVLDQRYEPFIPVADGLIKVCSWCFPGRSIVDFFPDLDADKLTHGVCAQHKAEMLAQISRMNAKKFLTVKQVEDRLAWIALEIPRVRGDNFCGMDRQKKLANLEAEKQHLEARRCELQNLVLL